MAAFQIPDHIDSQLDQIATATGQSKDDLILEALTDRFGFGQEYHGTPLSEFLPAELERMQLSKEQLDRGEFVSGEEVSAKLKRWQKEFSSR